MLTRPTANRLLVSVLFVAVVAGAFAVWLGHATAQTTLSVAGRVVNGTAGASIPSGLAVQLVAQAGDSLLARRETITDADGKFSFADIPNEAGASYFVVAEYKAVTYQARIEPTQSDANWRLTIYETTSEATNLRVTENTLFIPRTDPQRKNLLALELVRLDNSGDRTMVPDLTQAQPRGLLRFSLPPDAMDLDVQSSLRGGNVVPVDKGFAMTTPVPPGGYDILFTYSIPYSGKALQYTRTFPFGATTFELLVREEAGKAESPGLEPGADVTIDDKQYHRLIGKNLDASSHVDLTFTGMPLPTIMDRVMQPIKDGSAAKIGIPILATLLLALLVAYVIMRRRSARTTLATADISVTDAPSAGSSTERQALIDAVAELDEQLAQGTIQADGHAEKRAALMERIRAMGRSQPSEQ
ncbi:MAG: carboxypeptidase regulatory-like domain-containing protein [Dehalococcoidia bacterium]|nr:carboxypeptidase regulatory-like domain-containing protein [Dehalococcoidia bacterium]